MTTFEALEARLSDLATVVEFPRTPDLATAVCTRLRAPRVMPFRRSLRRSLLLAALLALLVVGAAFALRFGLELLSIERGPIPTQTTAPTASHSPADLGAGLRLGVPLSLDEARAQAAFDLLLPSALGAPDAIYFGAALRGQVALVYAPRVDLPASDLLDGAGLLITQNAGVADDNLAHKIVNTSTATVTHVDVAGAPGVWISGAPHVFWYFAPDGHTFINESRRVVGDTLAWEHDGILYRIEGVITLERALEIAASMT